ncbi:hypothetical protein JTB14_033099 [Gonioctena quinquepunctata]|nr:hypothetical protein JTB14_033099 [Gonioctena quinquepunctata]
MSSQVWTTEQRAPNRLSAIEMFSVHQVSACGRTRSDRATCAEQTQRDRIFVGTSSERVLQNALRPAQCARRQRKESEQIENTRTTSIHGACLGRVSYSDVYAAPHPNAH